MFSQEALQKVQRAFQIKEVVNANSEPRVQFSLENKKRKLSDASEASDEGSVDEPDMVSEDEAQTASSVDESNSDVRSKVVRGEESDRTAFVGNIPVSMKKREIQALFEPFGYVESLRLRSVPVAGTKVDEPGNQELVKKLCVIKGKIGEQKGSMNAYVVFREPSAVKAAAAALNNTLVGDRHIRVDTSVATLFEPSRSLFIGNLPYYADEEELRNFFVEKLRRGADVVDGVRIVRDQETLIGKGIAYILLRDKDSVMAALSLSKDSLKFKEKWTLRLAQCSKKGKPNKRQRTDATDPKFKGKRKSQDSALRRIKLKKVETKKKFLENRKKKSRAGGKPSGKTGK